MSWLAYVIGAFYLLGGLVALRQARVNLMLDRALAAVSLVTITREDRIVGAWMVAAAVLTLGSGAALLALSRWAVPVFVLCWLSQALYLLWAVRTKDYGRMATVQAFALYTLATLLVVWLHQAEILT